MHCIVCMGWLLLQAIARVRRPISFFFYFSFVIVVFKPPSRKRLVQEAKTKDHSYKPQPPTPLPICAPGGNSSLKGWSQSEVVYFSDRTYRFFRRCVLNSVTLGLRRGKLTDSDNPGWPGRFQLYSNIATSDQKWYQNGSRCDKCVLSMDFACLRLA